MPDSHLILVAGKHNLAEESIKSLMGDQPSPKDSEDCPEGKGKCEVFYGPYIYEGNKRDDERLSTFKRIEGSLLVRETALTNLSIFEKVTVVGLDGAAVVITGNYMLDDISSLSKMKMRGTEPVLKWLSNGNRWCHSKADLKFLSYITQKKPYRLGTLEWYSGNIMVDEGFLKELKETCSCGCGIRGSLAIHGLNGEKIDLTPLKNLYQVGGSLSITENTRLYDLRFLENLNSIGNRSADINDIQFELHGNVDLIDAYMENLVEIHGTAELSTCYDLPERTVKLFKDLTQGRAYFARDITGRCPSELIEKETERERIVDPRLWNQWEPGKSCFAGNDQELFQLFRTQSYARIISIDFTFSQVYGYHAICEHFYGHLKVNGNEGRGEFGFIQHLKKITGCLDIVGVNISRSGKINQSNFEELDLTNLAEIDYDAALCGNLFALHIRRNNFLRRIDFNENLILNGAYFIRHHPLNAQEMEIYSGGKPNSTIRNDPAGSTFYGFLPTLLGKAFLPER
nr:unnamed protein product [Haemonchus contortus]